MSLDAVMDGATDAGTEPYVTSDGSGSDASDVREPDDVTMDDVAVGDVLVADVADGQAGILTFTSCDAYPFGPLLVGQFSDYSLTLENRGTSDQSLGAVTSDSVGLSAPFSLAGGSCVGLASLSPLSSCTIVVRASPTSAGVYSGTIGVAASGPGGVNATCTVNVVSAYGAILRVPSAPTLSFGQVPVGATATSTVSVVNDGDLNAVLGATDTAGLGLALPFSVTGGTCQTGGTLPPLATCTLVAAVTPTSLGAQSDAIQLSYAGGVSSAVTLGLAATGTAGALLSLSDAPLFDFGSVLVGQSASKTLTVTNQGTGSATLGTVTTAGLGLAPPFSLSGGTCVTGTILPANAGTNTCTLSISFSPTQTVSSTRTLALAYQHGGASDVSLGLSGLGVSAAHLELSDATTNDFGTVSVGATSSRTFVVTNTGGTPATLGTVTSAGLALATPFALSGGTCATGAALAAVGGNNTCSLVVSFSPTQAGSASDTIVLAYQDGNGSASASRAVSGTATGATGVIITDVTTNDFGTVSVGASAARTFLATNAGAVDATLGTVTTAGLDLSAPYSLTGGTCNTGVVLSHVPGSNTCTLVLSFSPTGIGTANETVTLAYDQGSGSLGASRSLTGLGSGSAILGISDATTSDFGTVSVGASGSLTFHVTNTGNVSGTLGTVTTGGLGLSSPYSLTGGTCATAMALPSQPGSNSCSLVVTFSPTQAGVANQTATLGYHDGNAGATASRAITGTGGGTASLAISDASTNDFGTVAVGASSSRTFVVTNSGTGAATLGTVTTGGLGLSAPFARTGGTCSTGASLPATAGSNTCTIILSFTPSAATTSNQTVTLAYGGQNATRAVVGAGAAAALLQVSDGPSYDFGSVWHPNVSDKQFTLTNGGGVPATISGVLSAANLGLAAPFSIEAGGSCVDNGSIPPAQSCTLRVRFAPTVDGAYNLTLSVPYNDGTPSAQSATRALSAVGFGTSVDCTGGALSASPFAGGDGSQGSPYIICTPTQFNNIGSGSTYSGVYFRQGKSLDMAGVTISPVGRYAAPAVAFAGSFDGNGFQIVNVTITASFSGYGLFSYVGAGSTVQNVRMSIASGGVSGGGSYQQIGGLIGVASGAGMTVSNCSVSGPGTVSGESYVGGLIGHIAAGSLTLSASSASVNVSATLTVSRTGGLVGRANVGTISTSWASGSVTGMDEIGGLVGATGTATLDRCYATGAVSGRSYVGGLLGYQVGNVTNCYARGSVTGTGGTLVGGLIGHRQAGNTQYVYSTGSVSGNSTAKGGLCGDCGANATNSFWDTSTSAIATSSGGTGGATALLQDRVTLLGSSWNFDTTWRMPDGGGYPILQFQQARDAVSVPSLFAGGDGSGGNPYLIATPQQLRDIPYAMQLDAAAMSASYQLANDIDMAAVRSPTIGTSVYPFTGSFDGQGHTIQNVTLSLAAADNWGLFGQIGAGATLQNLAVTLANGGGVSAPGFQAVGGLVGLATGAGMTVSNCSVSGPGTVSGESYVGGLIGHVAAGSLTLSGSSASVNVSTTLAASYAGGLVGRAQVGTISTSWASGSVTGMDYVGGLVGGTGTATLDRCYATGAVSGRSDVGGLLGYQAGNVTNCYARGSVTGTGGTLVGGLIGHRQAGTTQYVYSTGLVSGTSTFKGGLCGDCGANATNSFWDTATSAMATSSGGTGGATALLEDRVTLLGASWNFDTTWRMPDGGGYPILQFQQARDAVSVPSLFAGGDGSGGNPYLIATPQQLRDIPYAMQLDAAAMSASYRLANDIDMAAVRSPTIGTSVYPFTGSFDGQGHTIQNVNLSLAAADNWGLFGQIGAGATLQNLAVTLANGGGVAAPGFYMIGGLVGLATGAGMTVSNCSVSGPGTVSGESYVGGLIGHIAAGSLTLSASSASVNVSATLTVSRTGGLVGRANVGTISTSWASGSVTGMDEIGGLVGATGTATLDRCYATGAVSGRSYVGGLLGYQAGNVTNCYARGSVTGTGGTLVGGLIGHRQAGTTQYVYSTGLVSGTSTFKGGLCGDCGANATNSFWDTATSAMATSSGGNGRTTADMTLTDGNTDGDIDIYPVAGWSSITWNVLVGSYPTLK